MPTSETEPVHFRCPCGRSVVTPPGSDAARTHRCSRCRRQRLRTALVVPASRAVA